MSDQDEYNYGYSWSRISSYREDMDFLDSKVCGAEMGIN